MALIWKKKMLSEVPNLDDTSCRVVVRHEDPTAATAGSLSPLTPSRAANSSTFFRMPDTPSKCRRTNHHRFIQLQSNALRQRAQQHTVSNSCSSVPHGGGVPTQVVAMSTNGHTKKHPRLESCFAESAMYTSCDSVEREMSRVNLHNNNCSSPSTTPALPAALSSSQLRLSQPGCPDGGFSQRTDISQETTMSQLLTKKVLTEYTEMCELGHGSFGRVILARENATNTLYAIKECPVEQTKHGERKMRQERDIMILVRSFPHCVLMSSYWLEGQSHPKLYLQVQYCPGGNVANEAHRRRALNQPWAELEILTFLGQMAMALDAMHTANVVHVDFKPENVLIDHARNYFLADFGCALFLDEHTGRPVLPPSLKPQTRLGSTGESQSTFLVDRSTDTQASQDEGDCRYAATDMINQKECYPAGGRVLGRHFPLRVDERQASSQTRGLIPCTAHVRGRAARLEGAWVQPDLGAPRLRDDAPRPLCPTDYAAGPQL